MSTPVLILALIALVGGYLIALSHKRPPRNWYLRGRGPSRPDITYEMVGGPDCEGCQRTDHTHEAKAN